MSDFMKDCAETWTKDSTMNKSVTENGALGYSTTGKNLLDMNFKVSSLRKTDPEEIKDMFLEAYNEDKVLAIKWIFFVRDIREGLGERRLFRSLVPYIVQYVKEKGNNKEMIHSLFECVLEYGRGDDLYSFVDTALEKDVFAFMKETLDNDLANFGKGSTSLLFKWMKSEHSTNAETKLLARRTATAFRMDKKEYRQFISKGRKQLDIVETKMSKKEWSEIDYEKVPSKASLNYRNAFERHDSERYNAFVNKVSNGEAKVNVQTLYPYEVVHKYFTLRYKLEEPNLDLENRWTTLVETFKEKFGFSNTLVVADGSGSMTWSNISGGATPLDIANSLAILLSELNTGAFRNSYITFSNRPQFVRFGDEGMDLKDKLRLCLQHCECANTNIEKVFELILNTAKSHNYTQADLPRNILIISDMEFDEGTTCASEPMFEDMAEKYKAAGYSLPRLIFWNICSRTNTIPLLENDLGVALISGFSPNILDMIMSEELDPYKCLVDKLNSPRYDKVEKTLSIRG